MDVKSRKWGLKVRAPIDLIYIRDFAVELWIQIHDPKKSNSHYEPIEYELLPPNKGCFPTYYNMVMFLVYIYDKMVDQ